MADLFKRIYKEVGSNVKKDKITDFINQYILTGKLGLKKYSSIDTLILSLKTLDLSILMPQLSIYEANKKYQSQEIKNVIGSGGASIIALLICVGYTLSEIYDIIMQRSFVELLEIDDLDTIIRNDIIKYKGQTDGKKLSEWINTLINQRFKYQTMTQNIKQTETIDIGKMTAADLKKLAKEKEKEKKEKKKEKKEKYEDNHLYTFKELYELTGKNLVVTGFSFEDPSTIKDNKLITSSAINITEHGGNHIIFFSAKTTPDVIVSDAIVGSCAIPGIITPVNINGVEIMSPFITYDYPIDCIRKQELFYHMPTRVDGIRVLERSPIQNLTGKYIDEITDKLLYKMYCILQHSTGLYNLTQQENKFTNNIYVPTLSKTDSHFPYFSKTISDEIKTKMEFLVHGIGGVKDYLGKQNIIEQIALTKL